MIRLRDRIIKATPGTAGVYTIIAQRCDCSRQAVSDCYKRDAEVKEIIDSERERIKDVAESNIINSIVEGDKQDSKWFLGLQARDRGYGDKLEISGGVNVRLSPEEVDKRIAELEKELHDDE